MPLIRTEDLFAATTKRNSIWDTVTDASGRGLTEIVQNLPTEPEEYQWCHDCKEYDQENHCCHRWSRKIRDAIAEIENAPMTYEKLITAADEMGYDLVRKSTAGLLKHCGAKMDKGGE